MCMRETALFLLPVWNLTSDVTIVLLDPSFLYDAGISSIREHLRQKFAYLCLHGF